MTPFGVKTMVCFGISKEMVAECNFPAVNAGKRTINDVIQDMGGSAISAELTPLEFGVSQPKPNKKEMY